MATVTVTFAAGSTAGSQLHRLAHLINKLASTVPDNNPTGASTVLTIDNAPSTGTVSVAISAGPYTGSTYIV